VDRVLAELPAAELAISASDWDPSRFDYVMKP
jgi:hypothetical protein